MVNTRSKLLCVASVIGAALCPGTTSVLGQTATSAAQVGTILTILTADVAAGNKWGDATQAFRPDVLDRLVRVSRQYRDVAFRFACTETTRWVRYRDSEASAESDAKERAYLLVPPDAGSGFEEYRDRGRPRKPFEARPPLSWAIVFDDLYLPYFSYSDLGEEGDVPAKVRRIAFRGALPFDKGQDIREWDGILSLDAESLNPLDVSAVPSNQRARLEVVRAKEQQALRFTITLFGGPIFSRLVAKTPFARSCRTLFAYQRNGVTLPVSYELRAYKFLADDQAIPWLASLRDYSDYRFFKTESSERSLRAAQGDIHRAPTPAF